MRERLSSLWTFFYRVIFPAVWIAGFGIGTLALWFAERVPPSKTNEMRLPFLAMWVIGSCFVLWFAPRLRTVWLEGDHLVVADFSKEEHVPLNSIQGVDETRFRSPKTIKVRLLPRPHLPEQLVFIAPLVFPFPFSVHPVVKRLRSLIETVNRR
jgi:hypothetical protein